ncbi:TPA: WbqC family protein [Clostridium botulinum]|uniref:WbqC family protein n=1 Tax=Clostridium botulinum TaxID=1491 RepID=UPI0029A1848B|nr:WbqC family protein [Clostridium botulinum]HDK7177436.1 WbqC family protein [Clostridium botulinum]HDK7189057.1 WbqC family protein [Clostridium botulinum]HDK7216278.1 WbqC family protein [Clostridium botulinum]HDK7222920.1 WbqC family protein [Clostridium botulinum]
MILSGHQPNYLPYPGLIGKIMFSNKFIYVTKVQFEKKSWQNRNRIKGCNGEILLTVPVFSKGKFKQNICDVKINNELPWRKKHFSAIDLNYKKSKYYNEYIGFFDELYKKEWNYLQELDIYIMNWILSELRVKTQIYNDKDFEFEGNKTKLLIDMCKKLDCDTYLSNKGSENYVETEEFTKVNLNHKYLNFIGKEYKQCFRDFIPYLSILDMLFNIGHLETRKVLDNLNNYKFSELNKKLQS